MDDEITPNVVHIDSTADGKWAAQAQRRQLERRADEAKAARLDAQFKLLGLLPAAVTYAEQVLAGKVEADPEKTKITLALIDRVLPKLSAVRVDAAQVAGVDDVVGGTAASRAWENAWIAAAAQCSGVWKAEEEERRRIAASAKPDPQPNEWAGDAIEGSLSGPED